MFSQGFDGFLLGSFFGKLTQDRGLDGKVYDVSMMFWWSQPPAEFAFGPKFGRLPGQERIEGVQWSPEPKAKAQADPLPTEPTELAHSLPYSPQSQRGATRIGYRYPLDRVWIGYPIPIDTPKTLRKRMFLPVWGGGGGYARTKPEYR
jgi:hypothetical protein